MKYLKLKLLPDVVLIYMYKPSKTDQLMTYDVQIFLK